jgi:hypothetical protein
VISMATWYDFKNLYGENYFKKLNQI